MYDIDDYTNEGVLKPGGYLIAVIIYCSGTCCMDR